MGIVKLELWFLLGEKLWEESDEKNNTVYMSNCINIVIIIVIHLTFLLK